MTYPVFLGAVVITAANKRIRFKEAAGAVGNVDLALGTYYLRGAYATNLLLRSEEIDNASWTKSSATATPPNVIIAPDGLTTAEKLVEDTTLAQHYAFQTSTISANTSYTFSLYVKAGERTSLRMVLDNATSFPTGPQAIFNLSTGVVSSSSNATASIVAVGSGWYRCAITQTSSASAATVNSFFSLVVGSTDNYLGDGVSGIYIWGTQLEAASTPGPYVVTTGAIATGPTNELALAIRNGLDAFGGGGNTYTVTAAQSIDTAAAHTLLTVTRATGTDTFQIVVDANQTFDMALIGIVATTANDALAKTSTRSCAAAWVSNDAYANLEPFSERVASITRAASGRVSGVSRSDRMQSWRVGLGFVHLSRTFVVDALLTAADTLEGFIERFGAGASFEMHDCLLSSGTTMAPRTFSTLVDVVHFSEDALTTYEPQAIGAGVPLYALDMTLHAEVV